jgi:hypothetical protein
VAISEKVRKRLEQLFALLGSDNVNEREAARAKLDEVLRKHRKTWNDSYGTFNNGIVRLRAGYR